MRKLYLAIQFLALTIGLASLALAQTTPQRPGITRVIPGTTASDTATAADLGGWISWKSTATGRTQTLPACNSQVSGQSVGIADGLGNSAANNISVSPASGQTVNGATTANPIKTNFGTSQFICDGTSNWILVAGGGSAGVNFSTTCPTSSQSGSSIAFTNNLTVVEVTNATGSFAPSATNDCGKAYHAQLTTGITVTLPVANGFMLSSFANDLTSTANVIFAPASGLIDGLASENLTPGKTASVWANGTNLFTDLNAAGASGAPPINVGYVTNWWYVSMGATPATGAVTYSLGAVLCAPFVVSPPGMTVKALGAYVTTADAANYVTFALYSNVNGRPSAKIDDIGTTAVAGAAGLISAVVSHGTDALAAGTYWACSSTDSATVVMIGVTGNVAVVGSQASATGAVFSGAQLAGIYCSAGTGCGPTWAAGSSGYAWLSTLSPSSWSAVSTAGKIPMLELQSN